MDWITAAIWAIVGLCIWVFMDSKKKYDAHLKECNDRRVSEATYDATVKERIQNIEADSRRNRSEIRWLGDCMISVCERLKIDRPDRPE
jgi:hypothetical protein